MNDGSDRADYGDSIGMTSELAMRFRGYSLEPIAGGESGAAVWRCTLPRLPVRFVKAASLAADLRLGGEAERLKWMRDNGVLVPAVNDYEQDGTTEYLVLDELPGLPASDRSWIATLAETIDALGRSLADLHATSIIDCPFEQGVALQIAEARRRLDAGRVLTEEFDDSRLGRDPEELFVKLVASAPSSEDLVLTHGDFCLPNVILRRGDTGGVEVSGFIDCGRAGVADRHQDLALAIRSIQGNFGDEWIAPFLRAYGAPRVEDEKVSFYLLLDEFF